MKKIFALIVFSFVIALPVQAQSNLEHIISYDTVMTILPDSSVLVSEHIEYDFGLTPHHGIFRNIPYKYQARGGNFNLRISDIAVIEYQNHPYQFSQSTEGDDLVLKIGDPDVLITGQHSYTINYKVKRAINYFDDHDELYWNVIGNGWEVPIEESSVSVKLSDTDNIETQCFTGDVNSIASECSIEPNSEGVNILSNRSFDQGEGLTIVVGFPKGLVTQPTKSQEILEMVKDNGILVLPIIVFVIMFMLWWKKGRDEKGKGTIVPQYDAPQNLPPLLLGTLADMRVDTRDIAAEIVYLATKGYLHIDRVEKKQLFFFTKEDFTLTKKKVSDSILQDPEAKLFDALFHKSEETSISSLKTDRTFQKELQKIYKDTYKNLTDNQYFRADPKKVAGAYTLAGIGLAALPLFFLQGVLGGLVIGSLVASGAIIFLFGLAMPARSRKGSEANEEIKGLKLYLSVAEKDRLEFHNAPELNPQVFEKLLPYAIALGVEKQWAKKFENIVMEPSWYGDGSGHTFSAVYFASSMHNFSSAVVSSTAASAAGGGSGFSGGGVGGGGGGGGGGSW